MQKYRFLVVALLCLTSVVSVSSQIDEVGFDDFKETDSGSIGRSGGSEFESGFEWFADGRNSFRDDRDDFQGQLDSNGGHKDGSGAIPERLHNQRDELKDGGFDDGRGSNSGNYGGDGDNFGSDNRNDFEERSSPDSRSGRDDRNFYDQFDREDFHDGPNEMSAEEEEKFRIFESTLRSLGKDTSILRDLIDNEGFSKQEMFKVFGKEAVLQAVRAAGDEQEFASMRDLRDSDDLFRVDSRYGPPSQEMMYGLLFQHIRQDISPRELVKECSDPESIVDRLMESLRSRVGDFQSVCDEFSRNAEECEQRVQDDCSNIGQPRYHQGADELRQLEARAWSCPPDENAIIKVCMIRSAEYNKERIKYVDEICTDRWEFDNDRIQSDCSQWNQNLICDEAEAIKKCVASMDIRREHYEDERQEKDDRYSDDERKYYEKPDHKESIPDSKDTSEHDDQTYQKNFQNDGPIDDIEDHYSDGHVDEQPHHDDKQSDGGQLGDGGQLLDGVADDSTDNEPVNELDHGSADEPAKDAEAEPSQEYEHEPQDTEPDATSGLGDITGNIVYEDRLDEAYDQCKREFREYTEPQCNDQNNYCTKEGFLTQCIVDEKRGMRQSDSQSRIHCKIQSGQQLREASRNCRDLEIDKKRCFEEASRHCTRIDRGYETCVENLEESKIRKFLLEEISKRCEFAGDIELGRREADTYEIIVAINKFASDDDLAEITKLLNDYQKLLTLESTLVIKGKIDKRKVDLLKSLPAVQRIKIDNLPEESDKSSTFTKKVAKTLASLKQTGSELPDNIAYVVESEAADIASISKNFADLEELEDSKGVGYKFKRIFGLMKEAEEAEVEALENNREKISESIKSLKSTAAQVDDPVAKAVILEQVEVLRVQQENINDLIINKQKKAIGLLSVFFG